MAWAGPLGEQRVEESRVALAEERFDDARRLAMAALREDPEAWAAWRLYLRASQRTGLEAVALAELAAADDAGAAVARAWWAVANGDAGPEGLAAIDDPRATVALGWTRLAAGDAAGALALDLPADDPLAMRLRLRALASLGRDHALGEAGEAWLAAHPEHPDVLAELWAHAGAPPRTQRRVLKALGREVPTADARWLLLALRTFVAADADADAVRVADRLESMGLDRPLPRAPWGDSMRRAMGKALSGYAEPELPETSEVERLAIVEAIAGHWLAHGRVDDAVALWAQAGRFDGAWEAHLGRAKALRAAGRDAAAGPHAEAAMRATLQSWHADPCGVRLAARLRAAQEVHRSFPGVGVPPALTEAARGRFDAWRAEADTPMLQWCLGARAGKPEGAGPFLAPERAAQVLGTMETRDAQAIVAPRGLPQVGDPFPAELLDVARAGEGAVPVVVTAWASWCGPCQKELPDLDAGLGALRDDGVAFAWLALSLDDQEPAFRRARQRLGLRVPVLERRPSARRDLAISEVPTTWLVGADGRVVWLRAGYDAALVDVLGERLVEVTGE